MKLSEQDYHKYPAWSYSLIAKYARLGFKAIKTLHDPVSPTPEMEFGSLVDCLITRGYDEARKRYVVNDSPIPTPAPKAVLDWLLQKTKDNFSLIPDSLFQEAMDACAYYPSRKFDTKLKDLSQYVGYYEAQRTGKVLITQKDWMDAKEMAENIVTAFSSVFSDDADTECIYQPQFLVDTFLENGKAIKLKCMVDFMKVNHTYKTIQLVDIKTSEVPGYDFAQQFVRMRYDIEAQVYSHVVKTLIDSIPEYHDYEILPYLFIDISRTDKLPIIYSFDQYASDGCLAFKDYKYKNWKPLLAEIIQYEAANAVVPSYISTTESNDIIKLLNTVNDAC